MLRLARIELRKILYFKAFWVLTGIYFTVVILINWGLPEIIEQISETTRSNELKLLKYFVFNFPDIWQNITWAGSLRFFIKVIFGMIMIIHVCQEYSHKTIRQNIISGMSRAEFFWGKVMYAVMLTLLSTFILIISGVYLGLMNSSTTGLAAIFGKMSFLFGYMLEIFTYLSFALLLGTFIKKTGFAISALFLVLIIELIVQYKLIPESAWPYLPVNAMNAILTSPNTSLVEISSSEMPFTLQTHVSWVPVLVAIGYCILYLGVVYQYLQKKNL